jgi:UDP-glucose:(heptosyl)LPS alpha-1,3-glucosyltransferase
MRLGVLLERCDSEAGGAEAHTTALLARAVEKEGFAALACLEGHAPNGVTRCEVDGAPARRPARDRYFAEAGGRALREVGCDVVLAVRHALDCDVYLPHGGLVEDALAARNEAWRSPTWWAALSRKFSRKRDFFLEAERTLLAGNEGPKVIAVSNGLAARIAQVYPAAKARTVVVPNGVDSERFDPEPFKAARAETRARLSISEDAYVGLLLAHDPWLKGLETALRAMARSEATSLSPGFHLVVAGKRADGTVRGLARKIGVGARVRLHEAASDPRPLYAAADVLVHPTFYDPMSLVCLEALSMGLPVVTTPRNGVWELMAMRGGIAVESPRDAEGVAVALRVLSDPRLRAETSDDARYVAKKSRLATRLDQVLDVCRAAARE